MDNIREAKSKVVHTGERTISNPKEPTAVEYCEQNYPITTGEFKTILNEMYITFCKKQRNYGPDNISVGTPLANDNDVKLSLTGLFFRMNDKISRIKQMVVFGQPDEVGESVADTYQDLAVYGVIAQLVQRMKWGK
jgi:hypothetical protein